MSRWFQYIEIPGHESRFDREIREWQERRDAEEHIERHGSTVFQWFIMGAVDPK